MVVLQGLLAVVAGAAWIGATFSTVVAGAPKLRFRHVILIVFENHEAPDVLGNSGVVFDFLALGPLVRPHTYTRATAAANHYGLLRVIEEGLRLPLLGRSNGARPITGIWRTGQPGSF